jgi:hypothetical protein
LIGLEIYPSALVRPGRLNPRLAVHCRNAPIRALAPPLQSFFLVTPTYEHLGDIPALTANQHMRVPIRIAKVARENADRGLGFESPP